MCGKHDCGSVNIKNHVSCEANCAAVSVENLSLKGFIASLNSIIECDCHTGGFTRIVMVTVKLKKMI